MIENNFYLVDCSNNNPVFCRAHYGYIDERPFKQYGWIGYCSCLFPHNNCEGWILTKHVNEETVAIKSEPLCLLSNRTFLPNSSIKCSILRMIASSKSDSLYRSSSLKSRKTYTKYVWCVSLKKLPDNNYKLTCKSRGGDLKKVCAIIGGFCLS